MCIFQCTATLPSVMQNCGDTNIPFSLLIYYRNFMHCILPTNDGAESGEKVDSKNLHQFHLRPTPFSRQQVGRYRLLLRVGQYLTIIRRRRGEYSPKITEPEANSCFSIFTHSSEYKKYKLSIFVY